MINVKECVTCYNGCTVYDVEHVAYIEKNMYTLQVFVCVEEMVPLLLRLNKLEHALQTEAKYVTEE